MVEAKGLNYLLEAIAKVKAIYPLVRFKVYGDGPLRENLVTYAGQLGLNGNAIFVGAFTDRKDLPRIMTQTDIFAMSSILEGQPMAVVEAMAYGCPIVATRAGGIPEIIEDGTNGLLCNPRDPADLAQRLCALIADPALRRILGLAARASYETGPFQPAATCTSFVSIYQDVLKAERCAAVPHWHRIVYWIC